MSKRVSFLVILALIVANSCVHDRNYGAVINSYDIIENDINVGEKIRIYVHANITSEVATEQVWRWMYSDAGINVEKIGKTNYMEFEFNSAGKKEITCRIEFINENYSSDEIVIPVFVE